MIAPSADTQKSIQYIFKGNKEVAKEYMDWLLKSKEAQIKLLLNERDTHEVARLQGSIANLADTINYIEQYSK